MFKEYKTRFLNLMKLRYPFAFRLISLILELTDSIGPFDIRRWSIISKLLMIFVSVVCMSMFFSVHYLTIYYLLQPYNAGTELKSGTYRIVTSATYLICFWMMQVRMPTLVFGIICIIFCLAYSVAACVLIYRFAPKTFRLRNWEDRRAGWREIMRWFVLKILVN